MDDDRFGDNLDRIWATILAIMVGSGFVNYLFNHDDKPWSWVGPVIYLICFVLLIIQIKTNKSLLTRYLERRRAKKVED